MPNTSRDYRPRFRGRSTGSASRGRIVVSQTVPRCRRAARVRTAGSGGCGRRGGVRVGRSLVRRRDVVGRPGPGGAPAAGRHRTGRAGHGADRRDARRATTGNGSSTPPPRWAPATCLPSAVASSRPASQSASQSCATTRRPPASRWSWNQHSSTRWRRSPRQSRWWHSPGGPTAPSWPTTCTSTGLAANPLEALRRLDAALLPYSQLCDAPAAPAEDSRAGLFEDARNDRRLLGEGGLPVRAFLAALPDGIPLSLEVRSRQLRADYPDAGERARRVHANAAHYLAMAGHGRTAGKAQTREIVQIPPGTTSPA